MVNIMWIVDCSDLIPEKLFLETRTTKTLEVPTVGSPKSYKRAPKIKTSLSPPTITHLLVSGLNFVPTPPISTHHPTLPLLSPPHLSSGTHLLTHIFIASWVPLYVIAITYFMAFSTMFHPLSFCATNLEHTKLRGLGYKQ